MAILINTYCTVVDLPEINFACKVCGMRDLSDRELDPHLNGFIGYVMSYKSQEMTQAIYYTVRHIQQVKHHISLEIEEDKFNEFADWAVRANAICFLPDGTIRNPSGGIIIPESEDPQEIEFPPYLEESYRRKLKTEARLQQMGIDRVPASLPPVIDRAEMSIRSPQECAERILALFVVAVRAESLNNDDPIDIEELTAKFPHGIDCLTEQERQFIDNNSPSQQEIINYCWRYECVAILMWCVGIVDRLQLPSEICDVRSIGEWMVSLKQPEFIQKSQYRSIDEILDELDFHYRLQWLAHQSRIDGADLPNGLHPGIIQERLYALNWLTRFDNAEWDDIDTPA